MAHPKRTKIQRERDRREISRLYLMGFSQTVIPYELQKITKAHYILSQPMINYDLKKIKTSWQEARIFDFDLAIKEQLEKIAVLEAESWEAWRQSKDPLGDPRYLKQVQRCIDRRCKLLGLDEIPKLKNLPTDQKEPPSDELTEKQLEILASLLERKKKN